MRKTLITLAALALPLAAVAQDEDNPVVNARQGYFKLLGLEMGALAGMAKGEVEYDAAAAEAHAADIVTLSTYTMDDIFAPGTSKEDLPGETRALPAIWEDMEDVQKKAMALDAAALELAEVAGDGRGALGPAVGKLGSACKSCHDKYRAEDF
jgi:cytochrome c556